MPQAQLFRLEAEVRCADGDCGKLRTLVISRGDDAVTHLVVEPANREGLGKIVPLGLVDTGLVDTGDGGGERHRHGRGPAALHQGRVRAAGSRRGDASPAMRTTRTQ